MNFARSSVWIVGLLLLTIAAADTSAREATLKLQDGRKITGDLVAETADTVILKVAGIETTFAREQIVSLEIAKTLTEQFTEERAKLKDDDYNGRYTLARKMFETRSTEGYKLASRELDAILAAKPDHQMAKLLKNVVKERLKLQPEDPADPDRPVRPDPTDPTDPKDPAPVDPGEGPRELTPEEINLIKVWEAKLDGNTRVVVPRKVAESVLENYQARDEMAQFRGRTGRQKFMALPGHEQLKVIFDLRARGLYKEVLIRSEPEHLSTFRQKIHRQLVIGYCGQCHGEGKAAGYYVVTRPAATEQTAMQNLMILRTTKASNAFHLIDPQNPVRSPLLQYALPLDQATSPHPNVKGFQPYFRRGDKDFKYKATLDWIRSTLYAEAGGYPGIEFKPPVPAKPASEEDEKPAEEPEPAAAENKPADGR